MNVAKYSLSVVLFPVTNKKLFNSKLNIWVQGKELVSSEVVNSATTPGLPYVHIERSQHLQQKDEIFIDTSLVELTGK